MREGDRDVPKDEQIAVAALDLVDEMSHRLERPPSLAEFAELLSQSLPLEDARVQFGRSSPRLAVQGSAADADRNVDAVYDLPDSLFVMASHLLDLILKQIAVSGPVKASRICSALVKAVDSLPENRVAGMPESFKFAIVGSRGKRNPGIGDVVAIPASPDGYFMAVVVAKNIFGTAFGVFRDRLTTLRVPRSSDDVYAFPIYSDDGSVVRGVWPVVGHSDRLRSLFPEDPEIYHEIGSAESSSGGIRDVSEEEASKVRLHDPAFSQTYTSPDLQSQLNSGFFFAV